MVAPKFKSPEAFEHRAKALELRRKGYSYDAIGEALGITQQSAHALVQRTLRAIIREPGEDVIAMERERLDAMHRALADRIEEGDVAAIDRGLAIMQRRARLEGLDKQPEGVRVDVNAGVALPTDPVERAATLRAMADVEDARAKRGGT